MRLFLRRVVNASGTLLHAHGADYARWVAGQAAGGGPLQVARAALLMPPPFQLPPEDVRAFLVPLLETGLASLGRAEYGHWAAACRADELEAAVAAARGESTTLWGTIAELGDENLELRKAVSAAEAETAQLQRTVTRVTEQLEQLRQETDQLRMSGDEQELDFRDARRCWNIRMTSMEAVVAAAQQSEKAMTERVTRLAGELNELRLQHSELLVHEQLQCEQLREAAQLAADNVDALSRSEAAAAELRQRPAIDVRVLRSCLQAVVAGPVDRRCRRAARQLLMNLE